MSKARELLKLLNDDEDTTLSALGKPPSPVFGIVKTKCSKISTKLKKKKKEEENE